MFAEASASGGGSIVFELFGGGGGVGGVGASGSDGDCHLLYPLFNLNV